MGWGTGDETKVTEAQVQVGVARQQMYKLMAVLRDIKHDEKRYAMLKLYEEAYEKLNKIDFHLNR